MTMCVLTTDSKKEEGVLVEADFEVVPRVGDTVNIQAAPRGQSSPKGSYYKEWAELAHWEWKVISCHHIITLMPDDITHQQRVIVEVGARKKLT